MHSGQTRKSGDPYFVHPANLAGVIADLRLDTASVYAGLLHDVVEDTIVSLDDVERQFGGEIATLVDGVTKLSKINFTSKEDRQAENFRKMVVVMARDIRVLLVKLCDRVDNMRTLEFMSKEAQERISRETIEIYALLANRLGMAWFQERARGPLLQVPRARLLQPGRAGDREEQARARQVLASDVSKTLSSRLAEQGFAADVSGRAKHLYSIWRKMKENDAAIDQINDLIAFRVVVESVSDCYAALGVIHSKWTPVPGRFRDQDRAPEAEYVPVAPHDGHRPWARADRDPDPDRGDAPGGRARDRRPLEVQGIGRRRHRGFGRAALRVAPPARRVAEGA